MFSNFIRGVRASTLSMTSAMPVNGEPPRKEGRDGDFISGIQSAR